MSRASGRPQVLKHLPFFEVLAGAPEGSPEAKLATAGLLSLRMIDHWVLSGAAIVEPESVSVRSVRQAIMALPPKEPVREALLTIVNTMQMLRNVDLVPVLPRMFAYAQLLERHHGSMALAADAYRSVARLADPEYDADLVLDTYHRLAFCERKIGALDEAMETSVAMAKLAKGRKNRVHGLRARMGMAQVAMARGDLAAADSQLVAIANEAEHHDLMREYAMATHNRSVVAARGGNSTEAILLAHTALQKTVDPIERDRVLSDLAAYLLMSDRLDAAYDALRVLELTASQEEVRLAAKGNLLIVAARTDNRPMFDALQRELAEASMVAEARVNYLIEVSRGLRAFGDIGAAQETAANARAMVAQLRLGGFADGLAELASPIRLVTTPRSSRTPQRVRDDPTEHVAAALRVMAAAAAA